MDDLEEAARAHDPGIMARRRTWAAAAVATFATNTRQARDLAGSDPDVVHEVVSDLLCDLRHLLDSHGVEWESVVARADRHYQSERDDPEEK